MTDTTTISITEAQRDELAALKVHDRESFKAVVGRLLDGETAPAGDGGADDDLRAQLDRIESAATTAEDQTGSVLKLLEDMGGR